ncbi:MAG: hypothetical protein ACREOH_11945, partial [Candidatus Entotheonellia bacterium]
LYDTVDAQVLKSDAYLNVSNHPTAWTQRIRPNFQNFVRNEYELLITLGTLPDRPAPYVLTLRLETDAAHEAEFNEWYNTDHLPALVSVPGVYAARRYRATSGEPKYLAVYELANPELLRGEAWKTAANSEWTLKLRPHFKHLATQAGRLLYGLP